MKKLFKNKPETSRSAQGSSSSEQAAAASPQQIIQTEQATKALKQLFRAIGQSVYKDTLDSIREIVQEYGVAMLYQPAQADFFEFDGDTNAGLSPVTYAAGLGATRVLQLMIDEFHVGIKRQDQFGNTAAITAAMNGHKDTLQMLLRNGSQLSEVNHNGVNVLGSVISSANNDMINFLLQMTEPRVDLTQLDNEKQNALYLAFCYANENNQLSEVAAQLMERGLNPFAKTAAHTYAIIGMDATSTATSEQRWATLIRQTPRIVALLRQFPDDSPKGHRKKSVLKIVDALPSTQAAAMDAAASASVLANVQTSPTVTTVRM